MVLGVAAIFAGTTSCTKDYTCSCTSSGFTYEFTLKESKKAAAYAVCEGKGIGSTEVDGTTVDNSGTTCTIK